MARKRRETVFTIGHSTRTIAEFVSLLQESSVTLLADIRSIPRSRAMPQFNGDTFPHELGAAGISYRHLTALGGRRHHRKGAPPSPNTFWKVAAFRNYADYAETAEFRAGLEELLELASGARSVIMCAEAVWWRCHRRIVADYLLSRGVEVKHIMGPGKVVDAALTESARLLPSGVIEYAGPADEPPGHATA